MAARWPSSSRCPMSIRDDRAAIYHNLGGLAHARGDNEAAEPLARRAIELRSAALGPRASATLLDRSAHAAILDGMGRSLAAEASIRELLGDLAAALGTDHPEVSVARNNLAAILQRRGERRSRTALSRSDRQQGVAPGLRRTDTRRAHQQPRDCAPCPGSAGRSPGGVPAGAAAAGGDRGRGSPDAPVAPAQPRAAGSGHERPGVVSA